MKFSIIIPAYNEEDSIESIIERCLEASKPITKETDIDSVEIIVVSDGSFDKTVERAEPFMDRIQLIAYKPNRGYGAAIKTGFNAASGDIVSFLDADGTCDPLYFIPMLQKMEAERLDIVLGSRMGKDSQMPLIRRMGNTLFVNLIRVLSKAKLTDSASGMRIIKRNSLDKIYPLPDGLHFTPAMSAKALFDGRIAIGEIEMTYAEREGRSKLSVLKDGWRFLSIIISTALAYNPLRFLGLIALLLFIFGSAYLVEPIVNYFIYQRLEEWMIYRVSAIVTAFVAALQMISVGQLMQKLVDATNGFKASNSKLRACIDFVMLRFGFLSSIIAFIIGLLFVGEALVQYAFTGHVTAHWSRILVGAFFALLATTFFVSGFLNLGMLFITEREHFRLNREEQHG